MRQTVPYLRVFVSSPGDVVAERKIALDVIERLQYRPAFRGKVAFEVIAWDKPGAGTAMRASLTPQEAINAKLPKPSQCDIVIVIFWSRIGTKFEMDGKQFESGTHWELLDALDSKRPTTLVYKRSEKITLDPSASNFADQLDQYQRLEALMKGELFYTPNGTILRGINFYPNPDDFREKLELALEECLVEILDEMGGTPPPSDPAPANSPNVTVFEPQVWTDSPFPGLQSFTEKEAPIFFGRGRETDVLAKKVEQERFVAVVGASGSGKSSLVAAGLFPRLKDKNASITKDWHYVRFTPGSDPLMALAEVLLRDVPPLKAHPMAADTIKAQFIAACRQNPAALAGAVETALTDAAEWVQLLIFVDQFEELFTLTTSEEDRQAFVNLLTYPSERVRVVVTMRADFYHRALPYLEQQLREGNFTLDKPDQFALLEMIKRPAERAALQFEDGLPEQIVRDTGDEPGALALMAYALDELYHDCKDKKHLTFADYEALGGVQGAIGKRAEKIFSGLHDDAQAMLPYVFRELVAVDENGTPTRRRMPYGRMNGVEAAEALVDAFTTGRLLTQNRGADGAVVEVAHEALFRHWPKLVEWIRQAKGDLYMLDELRRAAALWESRGRNRDFLWLGERGQDVQAMLARLQPKLDTVEQAFARPEADHLLDEIADIDTPHARRSEISLRLHTLGDPRPGIGVIEGVPNIVWCAIPGGQVDIEGKTFEVAPFYMAKYLITYPQFQAFLDAEDGFENDLWWVDLMEEYRKQAMVGQSQRYSNYPRDSVSWYQAMAFTRWLNHRLHGRVFHPENDSSLSFVIGDGFELRLPTEWEWQHAATSGNPQNKYPWGDWDGRLANTKESGIGRSTAVGMYPAGRTETGLLDMAGNLWEWCLNDILSFKIERNRENMISMRGGSYQLPQNHAACAYRDYFAVTSSAYDEGFRVVCGPLSAL